jgi:hypothetical protein
MMAPKGDNHPREYYAGDWRDQPSEAEEIISLTKEVARLRRFGKWTPAPQTAEHVLLDQLVVGRVERFFDDGPCYAWLGDKRLGAFTTDTAAREAIETELRNASSE